VHCHGLGIDLALRVDVPMEGLPGRHAIENLDTADLDQSIAPHGIEASGFSIKNDFAHGWTG
jgi:hypothetical protein